MSADKAEIQARALLVLQRMNEEREINGAETQVLPDDPPEVETTSWVPIDLAPFLSGEFERPEPSVGMFRSDGVRFIYPGREHVIMGETESGKTWLLVACVAAELMAGNVVGYIHFEEGDPASTVERLLALGVPKNTIQQFLWFVAPSEPLRGEWVEPLTATRPVLVVMDGVNEAMSLHGAEINDTNAASYFRRRVVTPFIRSGAATVSADHVTKKSDGRGRYAIGSGHKLNALDGAAFMVETVEPFGRGLRGHSNVYVVKDRPGQLRAKGQSSKSVPGKTFFGTLVVDATDTSPDFLVLYAPKDDDGHQPESPDQTADDVWAVIAAQPDQTVASERTLLALLKASGIGMRKSSVQEVVDDLLVRPVGRRVIEVSGSRGAKGYQAISDDQGSVDE